MTPLHLNFCSFHTIFDELIEGLAWGAEHLGHSVTSMRLTIDYSRINILFGGVNYRHEEFIKFSKRLINFNAEQIGGEYSIYGWTRPALGPSYFHIMRNMPNWDYSPRNIPELNASGVSDVHHVPIGYAPVLERVPHADKDIDVVFYGSMTPRRAEVIEALQKKGLKVVFTDTVGWTRETRDSYIGRAKVVLNLSAFEAIHVFEEVRTSYLFANRVAVVSELGPDTYIEDDMRAIIAGAQLEDLPDLCVELCADDTRRQEIADRGYEGFRQRPWLEQLNQALEDYAEQNPVESRPIKRDVTVPTSLNIGSGKSWKYDFFNIDIDPDRGADLVCDLNEPFAFDTWLHTWRFGDVKLPKGYFDYILAEHVFEHVHDLVQCMTTCLDWLKVEGVLEAEVPYDLSYGAWQDPTHVRAFNERSWWYYSAWCWYVGWREHCFDIVSQIHVLSDVGQKMSAAGATLDVIARTPRAVDALRVKLRKRPLTDAEKADHQQYFRNV